MKKGLHILYRATSWLCAAMAGVDSALFLVNGCTAKLDLQYRIVTFAAATIFGLIAGAAFFLERSLSQILRHQIAAAGTYPPPELNRSWLLVHSILTLAAVFLLVIAAGCLMGIISRLREGFSIFG